MAGLLLIYDAKILNFENSPQHPNIRSHSYYFVTFVKIQLQQDEI